MLQCPNKCAACSGDQRECTCADQPPAKKKRASQKPSSSQPAAAAKADPKKLYDRLVKEHERVGVANDRRAESRGADTPPKPLRGPSGTPRAAAATAEGQSGQCPQPGDHPPALRKGVTDSDRKLLQHGKRISFVRLPQEHFARFRRNRRIKNRRRPGA